MARNNRIDKSDMTMAASTSNRTWTANLEWTTMTNATNNAA